MRLVDAHCHLEAEEFSGRVEEIVAEARAAGIVKLVTASWIPGVFETSRFLAERFPEVSFAWGIHPWYACEEHFAGLDTLMQARTAGAVAIGEIGLDGKIPTPMDLQVRIFEAQLAVARELDLPVILHCRGAFNELLLSVRRVGLSGRGGLVHAFSGSVEMAEACLQQGLYVCMGGALSYRRNTKRERALRRVYPEYLLLETDSPDIPPVQAEKPNLPKNIRYNLAGAAAYLELPEEEVAEQTTQNAYRLFGWREDPP
jgi:TatD DNase family protein